MTMGYIPSTPPRIEFLGNAKIYDIPGTTKEARIEAFKKINDPLDSITAMVMGSLFNDSIGGSTQFGGGYFGGGGAGGEF